MGIVNIVRRARKEAGLTQLNLSAHCGVEVKRLRLIERNEAECTLEEALAISLSLGCDVKDAFFRDPAADERIGGCGKGPIDLVGAPFGELRVVARAPGTHSHKGEAFWLCECSCGSAAIVRSDHLRSGHTRSCGCRASPNFGENNSVRL